MTQPNPAQWLAEVQTLQRQISELQQERERAYESASNWRKLYDQEAQQRRRDAAIATGKIERLQKDLSDLRTANRLSNADSRLAAQDAAQDVDEAGGQNPQVAQLNAALAAAKQECQQLHTQIEAERAAHAQTRNSLTAALGDAVDLLSKERSTERLPAQPE